MTNTKLNHSTFTLIREQDIESLNLTVQEFQHIKTGAQHIHLSPSSDAGDSENVFLVALRTVPHDSSGVAHVLEHTALCGSKKYPVRDPFFMMTRRSINTFMNAFTSSDWTAYPFASLNKKDFSNLLDVYLDAVFFSRLDKLDFAQEGHRLEFSEPDNSDSVLEYKGIVFNEMKGAMSSVPSQLWHTIGKYLYPSTTYHYNSGGDPEAIPDLSYEQLIAFYKTHYHPSNAIFMTYGDITAKTHQQKFEQHVLVHFERLEYTVSVPDEKRFYAPVKVQESYPMDDEDISEKTHVVLAWLLGKSTNLRDSLRAQLLSGVLLNNSATPLMHALESSDLGHAPSPLCGLDGSQKELTFLCGLAGCNDDTADQVEALIMSTLEKVAKDGIASDDVASALHQLELHQREVGGDSYPYGLQLILTALTNATHRGDPVGLLNIDGELEQLRKDVQNPDFIKTLAQELLIDNQHCVRLTMLPNKEISARKETAEKQKLATIQSSLSEEQKTSIIEQAAALKKRQAHIDDENILPKVTLKDVPKSEASVEGKRGIVGEIDLTEFSAGTNGLVYQQAIFEIPKLPEHLISKLPLYGSIISELGVGDNSYLEMQRRQASVSGGFGAYSSIRSDIFNPNVTSNYFTVSGKALNRNHAALSDLMKVTIDGVRFDELGRLEELISQIKTSQEQRVTGNGHSLAMTAASAGICAAAKLNHTLSGLAGIKAIKALHVAIKDSTKNKSALSELAEALTMLHGAVTHNTHQLLLVGEEHQLEQFKGQLGNLSKNSHSSEQQKFALEPLQYKVNEAWITNTQVNFCAKSYATVSMGHPDAAPLVVLGGFLRNGFLHTAIREQGGAYGGGASQDSNIGAFRFYSYRDPRLAETLKDFDRALTWLQNEKHPLQKVEEAILGTISSLDKSESPAGRAKRCFHAQLHGRTVEQRQIFRERILGTTLQDLQRVAATYLLPEKANTAVVSGAAQKNVLEDLGLELIDL
ncbi:MAG: Zn-dependent M16 (insulinase) family peptidase [Lentisphaeria bacterium]|jgi:Zn-dependent M16 (insulinase) family peptidase